MEVRKCRVCGCTENDCGECIEKTGQPCHWVAEDLCSACEEPQQISEGSVEAQAQEQTAEAAAPIELPDGFFQGLAALGHVDITIRVMQKEDKLTVSLLPHAGNKGAVSPVFAIGTPVELDRDLLKQFGPKLQVQMQAVSKELASAANAKRPEQKAAAAKAPAKTAASKKPAPQKPKAKESPEPKKEAEKENPATTKKEQPKAAPAKKAAAPKPVDQPRVIQNQLF